VITDAAVIKRYYRRAWRCDSVMIPYGGDLPAPQGDDALRRFGLEPQRYLLFVSRLEPENNPDRVIESYRPVPGELPLVLVGGAPYAPELQRRLARLAAADPRVLLAGPVYGEGYRQLLFNAAAYIHATEVGGTHPALVEAMGAGRVVFFLDNLENREVAGGAGVAFRFAPPYTLSDALQEFVADEARFAPFPAAARARVAGRYRWDAVTDAYETLLEELCFANPRA